MEADLVTEGLPSLVMKINLWNLALGQFADVFGKTRFISGRRVFVDNALIDRLVDKRDCRIKQLLAVALIVRGQSCSQFFDLRSQFASVAPIDLVTLEVLTNPFFC